MMLFCVSFHGALLTADFLGFPNFSVVVLLIENIFAGEKNE